LEFFHISDNNEKYYICNICSNNNDEFVEVVISVSESVLFIADISVIRISVNLLISAPLISMAKSIILLIVAYSCSFSALVNRHCDINTIVYIVHYRGRILFV